MAYEDNWITSGTCYQLMEISPETADELYFADKAHKKATALARVMCGSCLVLDECTQNLLYGTGPNGGVQAGMDPTEQLAFVKAHSIAV